MFSYMVQVIAMDIESLELGGIVLILIIGLSIFLWGVNKYENRTIEQSDNLEKICLKAYKSDLKNDDEVKKLCKNVKVRIEELEKGNNTK